MDDLTLDRDFSKSKPDRFAGFWIRFVAVFIDSLVISILNGFIASLMGEPFFNPKPDATQSFIFALVGWLYYAIMESSGRQATLGKIALGLRVVDHEGESISFAKATGRYFAKVLSALILLIGFFMAAFDQHKQALHDRLAGTFVLRD